MIIWNVVFIEDGLLHRVHNFKYSEEAAAKEQALIKEHGVCIEDMYEHDSEHLPEIIDSFIHARDRDVRTVEGKHYYLYENDRIILQANVMEFEKTHCVWLPDAEVIKGKIGRDPTEDELLNVRHTFEKGIDGQVDWHMAFDYAIEENISEDD